MIDTIILKTTCPNCKQAKLEATVVPGPSDEDGHSDEFEVSIIRCSNCGHEIEGESPLYQQVENLLLEGQQLVQTGRIWSEF